MVCGPTREQFETNSEIDPGSLGFLLCTDRINFVWSASACCQQSLLGLKRILLRPELLRLMSCGCRCSPRVSFPAGWLSSG